MESIKEEVQLEYELSLLDRPLKNTMKKTCRHHDWRGFGKCPYCKAKERKYYGVN